MPQNKKVKNETAALPTSEELRHLYGDTTYYVRSLAARAKRSAERAGADKKRSKEIEEELKLILDDLDQALKDDVASVEAGHKPYAHVDLENIIKKSYNNFADLAADYFDDYEDEDEAKDDEKSKAKSFYLIDGKTFAMDDPTVMVVLAAAISAGKPVQKLEIKDDGTPEITTVVEGKKKKAKADDDGDADADDTDRDDADNDDEDAEPAGTKKLKIKFGGKKITVPVLTKISGSGKSKKTRSYALAAADGSEVFTSFADANDSDDPVVWYELARITVGVKADGSEKFNYELATDSPNKLKYLKG